MPHIITEYSSDVADHVDIPNLLQNLHNKLADLGIDKTRIKTRGIALPYAIVGDQETNGHMVHTTLLLLKGRDAETLNNYGKALKDLTCQAAQTVLPNAKITLEIREMDNDLYFM